MVKNGYLFSQFNPPFEFDYRSELCNICQVKSSGYGVKPVNTPFIQKVSSMSPVGSVTYVPGQNPMPFFIQR